MKTIDAPPSRDIRTFKKAPKVRKKEHVLAGKFPATKQQKNPLNPARWFKGFLAKYHFAGLVFLMLHSTAVFWGTGLIVLSYYSGILNRRFKIYTIIHSRI